MQYWQRFNEAYCQNDPYEFIFHLHGETVFPQWPKSKLAEVRCIAKRDNNSAGHFHSFGFSHTDGNGHLAKMPKKPNQCAYSSRCRGRLAIKKNGKTHTMCETHRRYQANKQQQRRCEKHPRTLRETQCRYPGCEETRAIKGGKMLQLCEMHRARHNEGQRLRYGAQIRPGRGLPVDTATPVEVVREDVLLPGGDSELSTRPSAARMPSETVSESEAISTAGTSSCSQSTMRTVSREMPSNSFRPDDLSRSNFLDLSHALTDRQHQRSQADALFVQRHAEIWSKQYISALNKHSN